MIALENIEFSWGTGPAVLSVNRFRCAAGENVFLQGASGSGKSTLLNIICGVLQPDSGTVDVLGHAFHRLKPARRDSIRAEAMGVIFQQFNLVPFLDLVENVLLPARFSAARRARIGDTAQERREKAYYFLDIFGLGTEARSGRTVTDLSVGQQQRVAAARALIGEPSLIIADEPTSSLDRATRDVFIDVLLKTAAASAVLFVSHDPDLAAHFDRSVIMADINRAAPATAGQWGQDDALHAGEGEIHPGEQRS